MKKIVIILLVFLSVNCLAFSQTYTVSQQSQQVNINVPVIEKPVYIEKYRTVYVDRPRVAKKLEKPIKLLGYLWVYPEDLGSFKQMPIEVIQAVNAQNPYDRNNWRIPTPDELAVLEANADKVGLGSDIYLATDHRNGVLRLVSTGLSLTERKNKRAAVISSGDGKLVGKVIWQTSIFKDGLTYRFNPKDVRSLSFPRGWRLPKIEEVDALLKYNGNDVVKAWQCLREITLDELKIDAYWHSPGRNGGSSYEVNVGHILYQNKGEFYGAGFWHGKKSGTDEPRISYGSDLWSHSGYIILVFDESLL